MSFDRYPFRKSSFLDAREYSEYTSKVNYVPLLFLFWDD